MLATDWFSVDIIELESRVDYVITIQHNHFEVQQDKFQKYKPHLTFKVQHRGKEIKQIQELNIDGQILDAVLFCQPILDRYHAVFIFKIFGFTRLIH